ncbi:MAG: sortase B protein-sorting domain-containing protein, partial [Acutalibacteraceae bacterium]
PQTGDNSHMALWLALLFVSGASVIGTTVYGKKKRAK